ncbi:EAL domain-containing protein [Treponema zioleckii]|uniref:EAL domain-containing protein n=1 Tax=Treponema zioleckii TaxID=331680 RepID=UPI00168B0560|nr:EAL domain-containing protein [Treponema zioleckii]
MSVQTFTKSDFNKKYIQNGFSFMPGGFLIYRADDTEEILYANPSLLEIFECETEEQFLELTGGTFKGVVYSEDLKSVESSIKLQHKLDQNFYDNAHYRIMTRSGKLKYVQDFGKLCFDEDEGPLFYVFISFLKIKLDLLTGLPLRWYFIELVKQGAYKIIEDGGTPVIIAFDFTGMKTFNNRYGVEEGDNHLLNFAHILKKHLGSERCSRFGEDHFYGFCDSKDVEGLLNNVIIDLNVSESNPRNLPLRMGIAEFPSDISVDVVCNRAKAAADTLKGTQESDYAWFNEKMSKILWKKEYIISHIHQAINERWVEPYYQPVVRTLNGRLCNLEALARWRDPEHGLISPADFIPILEENGLSYKLDMYIVERVLTMLQHRIKEGLPVVPISVNISRSDFDYCDPVKIISSACDIHGVKRGLIAIEITESSLMSNQDVIRHAIDRFHAAGFEVWMDDFGSGYSSLNVLKDFDFDEIKIDMAFLRDFNERSRKIVTMAVKMAKALGIHTLAEGVETEEHIDFLKSIGCERIQGYYYGKPDAITEQLDHLKRTGINFETLETASFYQKTGLIDFVSKRPFALFFYDGKRFTTIFRNNKYIEEIAHANIGDEFIFESYMNQLNSVLGRKFRALAEKTISSGNREIMTFVVNNRYFRFMFASVASSRQGNMLSATIDGSIYEEQQNSRQLDIVMRNIMAIYESIYLIDFKEDSRTVIVSNLPNENEGDVIYGLKDFYAHYNVRYIHVDDLERFRKLMNRKYIAEMFKLNERGSFSDLFPVKKDNGSYEWTSFLIISIPDTDGEKLLVCIKPSLLEDQKDKKILVDRLVSLNNILSDSKSASTVDFWNSAVFESDIKFFWKDKNRRFLGASRAFLNYYGMRSSKTIIGKTDEEIGWHIDDSPFKKDEMDVLEKGIMIQNASGKNIINGLPHDIQATKFPIYHDGKIVGLMGYFFDSEIDEKRIVDVRKKRLQRFIDWIFEFSGHVFMPFRL